MFDLSSSMTTATLVPTEDPISYWRNPKFQTCCCHVKTVATVLGVMSIVSSCVLITYSMYNLIEINQSATAHYDQFRTSMPLVMSLVFSLLSLIFVCLMFYGLSKELPLLLVAHLVVHALTVFCWSAIFTVKFVYVIRFSDLLRRASLLGFWIVTLAILFLYLILQFYYFYVSYKCFLYIKAKKTAVNAVEMFNHWAVQTPFASEIQNSMFNNSGSVSPSLYSIMNPQHSSSYAYPPAPPPYDSFVIPADVNPSVDVNPIVVTQPSPHSTDRCHSPPPVYSAENVTSAGYQLWK